MHSSLYEGLPSSFESNRQTAPPRPISEKRFAENAWVVAVKASRSRLQRMAMARISKTRLGPRFRFVFKRQPQWMESLSPRGLLRAAAGRKTRAEESRKPRRTKPFEIRNS